MEQWKRIQLQCLQSSSWQSMWPFVWRCNQRLQNNSDEGPNASKIGVQLMASIYAGTGFSSMQPDTDCPGSITMVKRDFFCFVFLGWRGHFCFFFVTRILKCYTDDNNIYVDTKERAMSLMCVMVRRTTKALLVWLTCFLIFSIMGPKQTGHYFIYWLNDVIWEHGRW